MHTYSAKNLRDAYNHMEQRRGEVVNVAALVHECTMPTKSKGTDHFCTVTVYDDSTEDWGDHPAIQLMLFAPEEYQLPAETERGDIIRLTNVKVSKYMGQGSVKPQLLGTLRKSSQFRYLLFRINELTPYKPDDAGSFSMTESDKARMSELRQYHQRRLLQTVVSHPVTEETYLRTVCNLWSSAFKSPVESVDVICKVLAVDRRHEDRVVVHVWDGTDAKPLVWDPTFAPNTGGLKPLRHELPLCSISSNVRSTKTAKTASATTAPAGATTFRVQACADLPPLGTAVPVLGSTGDVLPLGKWFKLKRVIPTVVQGQLQLLFNDKSRVVARPEGGATEECMRSYDARCAANTINQHTAGPSSFRSRCECPSETAPQTVRQLLLAIQRGISGVFRLNVRICKYFPTEPDKMLVPVEDALAPEDVSAAASSCGHTYALKLAVEDCTGQVDVVLLGKDAERFFQDLPPFAPGSASAESAAKLQDWLTSLAVQAPREDQGAAAAESVPWLDCCVRVAFMDHVSKPEDWVWPCVRMVQTVGVPPWAP